MRAGTNGVVTADATANDARGERTFGAALTEHLGALQAKDAERFGATLGEDVVVVDGAGAMKRGRDVVLRSHAEWFASSDPWTFEYEVVLVREMRDAALALIDVTYRHRPELEPARFLLSLVFARDANGEWKFVYDQNTPHRG